jgi:hypothetical protein
MSYLELARKVSRTWQPSERLESEHVPTIRPTAGAVAGIALPRGIRLIRWEPKSPPVAIDVCSVVADIFKFIHSELRALDSRLNDPWTIHGGFTVPQMLDRLAQAGLEVELEPKGGASTTKCQDTGRGEIK